jgi:predicted transcriptional regulator
MPSPHLTDLKVRILRAGLQRQEVATALGVSDTLLSLMLSGARTGATVDAHLKRIVDFVAKQEKKQRATSSARRAA